MKAVDFEMATADEDLVTCGVCLCEYDDVNRKPKFLQCAHTGICQGDLIKCPFCRETFVKLNVESLPNNTYALHMVKFKENKKELPKPIEVAINPLAVSFCLTCGSAEKPGCAPSGNLSVDMTADAIRNLEGLLKLKEELLKMKDTGTVKLNLALQERKKVQEQLSLILKSIQSSEEDIKKLQDENNFQIIQMVSLLERRVSKSDSQDDQAKKEFFFSQLMSLVEGSTAEDTEESLKKKMEKSIELYEQKLCDSMAIASEYELRKKVKIAVHLYDENDIRIPTVPWLEEGFRFQPLSPSLTASQIRQDSLLVSHAVFSLLRRQKIQLKKEEPATSAMMREPQNKTTVLKSWRQASSTNARQSSVVSLPPSVPSINKFVLNNESVFKLRVFKWGILKGEIAIRPVLGFERRDFMRKLGEFCFRSQKVFCNKINKALARVYVTFQMSNAKFQPAVPLMRNLDAAQQNFNRGRVLLANQMDDVGIAYVNSSSDKVTGWTFVFPLKHFQHRMYAQQVRNVSTSQLFGRVIGHQTMDCFFKLSYTANSDRKGFTITLESQ